jgi:hypothetical protein
MNASYEIRTTRAHGPQCFQAPPATPGDRPDIRSGIVFLARCVPARPACPHHAIGNPEVADANVGDDRTIVTTAKAAGVTNMIVVDEAGSKISSAMLRVSRTSQSHRERGPAVIRRCKDSWSTSEYARAAQREPAGTRPSAATPRRGLGDRSGCGSTPSASVQPAAPEPNGSGSTSP